MLYQICWILFILFCFMSLCAYVSMNTYKGFNRVLMAVLSTVVIYLVFGLLVLLICLPRLLGWF